MRSMKTVVLPISVAFVLTLVFFIAFTLPLRAGVEGAHSIQPAHTADQSPLESSLREMPVVAQPVAARRLTDVIEVKFGPVETKNTLATTANPAALAKAWALALDVPKRDLLAAELVCAGAQGPCTDPAALAVLGLAPGTWFPTRGTSFAFLATSAVSGSLQTEARVAGRTPTTDELAAIDTLHGMTTAGGADVVRLHLMLKAPPSAKCFSLDFAFYTVDLPSEDNAAGICTVGDGDTFSVHVNDPSFSPATNIARNLQGQVVSVATMNPFTINQSLHSVTGTNTPGAFPLLQVRHPVTGGVPLDLYFSIEDLVDPLGASAAALDNFRWITDTDRTACQMNTGYSGDRDGDGLADGWEMHGTYDRDARHALRRLDLPALGANPDVKDIFVEIDSMSSLDLEDSPSISYDPKPLTSAIDAVVAAFAASPVDPYKSSSDGAAENAADLYKGIQLHVDYGQDAPLTSGPATRARANFSHGGVLPEKPTRYLCTDECGGELLPAWEVFNTIKATNFSPERWKVFHYALFAHRLAPCETSPCTGDKVSGMSRNLADTGHGASDLIVSLGDPQWWNSVNLTESLQLKADRQAGTFMHELGHNLGLNHYGLRSAAAPGGEQDRILNKPNHLSVMNYLYQTTGLVVSDPRYKFDYMRFDLPTLNENFMTDSNGIGFDLAGIHLPYVIGIRYARNSQNFTVTEDAMRQVDWNKNGWFSDTGEINITGDFTIGANGISRNKAILSDLAVENEWDDLVFTGGNLNRQRSLLYPSILKRKVLCLPGSQFSPTWLTLPPTSHVGTPERSVAAPPPTDIAALELQAREELTPELDLKIRDAGP